MWRRLVGQEGGAGVSDSPERDTVFFSPVPAPLPPEPVTILKPLRVSEWVRYWVSEKSRWLEFRWREPREGGKRKRERAFRSSSAIFLLRFARWGVGPYRLISIKSVESEKWRVGRRERERERERESFELSISLRGHVKDPCLHTLQHSYLATPFHATRIYLRCIWWGSLGLEKRDRERAQLLPSSKRFFIHFVRSLVLQLNVYSNKSQNWQLRQRESSSRDKRKRETKLTISLLQPVAFRRRKGKTDTKDEVKQFVQGEKNRGKDNGWKKEVSRTTTGFSTDYLYQWERLRAVHEWLEHQ